MDLVSLLIVVIVIGLLWYIVSALLPIPQPFKNVALIILCLIFILWLLGSWGGYIPVHRFHYG